MLRAVRRAAAQLGGALGPAGQLAERRARLRVHGDELRLNGGGVDALVMEKVLDALGYVHVGGGVVAFDVGGGDNAAACQLPDVQLVHRQDALQVAQPSVELMHVDLLGHGLQQDERGLFQQRVRGVQEDADHDDAQGGVQIKHPAGSCYGRVYGRVVGSQTADVLGERVVGTMRTDARVLAGRAGLARLPHEGEDDGVDHHDHRAKSVAQDVQENATHVELGGGVLDEIFIRSAAVDLQIQAVAMTHL